MTTDGLDVGVRILDRRVIEWGFPRYGSDLAAGLDLHACIDAPMEVAPGEPARLVSAGIAVLIGEPGWFGLVAPRSGLGHRGLVLGNAVGVIDADYEGPILMSLWNRNAPSGEPIRVEPGDRVAQLLIVPVVRPRISIVQDAAGSARASGGFGSTGTRAAKGGHDRRSG